MTINLTEDEVKDVLISSLKIQGRVKHHEYVDVEIRSFSENFAVISIEKKSSNINEGEE